ncbi:MAG TPA: hypothetical protein VGX52_19580 [Burkholderiales bacterium]|nr:hypothetical protein [Burkholderiales bacterium]
MFSSSTGRPIFSAVLGEARQALERRVLAHRLVGSEVKTGIGRDVDLDEEAHAALMFMFARKQAVGTMLRARFTLARGAAKLQAGNFERR